MKLSKISNILCIALICLSTLVQVSGERVMAAAATEEASWLLPNGIWTFRGYGYVLQVVDGVPTLLDETATSCITGNQMLLMGIHNVEINDTGDVAKVSVFRFVPYFVLDRSESFQAGCANGTTPVIEEPGYVRDALVDFDILAQTFSENFAHFDNRLDGGRNEWDELTSQARATLTSDSSDDELVTAFQSMLVPLNDYHTWVADETFNFLVESDPFLWQFQEEFEQQDAISDWETYKEDKIFAPWLKNAEGYMTDAGLKMFSSGLASGLFQDENIGYMWLRTIPDEPGAFAGELDEAILALKDTEAIIVDIRINAGGSDATAIDIASHFSSEPFLAFTKLAVGGEEVEVYVEPSDPAYQYDGKVIVIISGATYSAAETMPLAMMQLPQITLLGQNTGGSYSETPKRLPNGWFFSFFSEEYLSPNGMDYDEVGIPPDVSAQTELLLLSEREAGVDSWLELALETAKDDSAAANVHLMSYLQTVLVMLIAWAHFISI